MLFKKCLFDHIDSRFVADVEATRAVDEFMKNIPGRVLEIDIETDHSNKQGVIDGERIYKLGVIVESGVAFIEFFENRNQGEPTMAIYVDKIKSIITIKGWKVDKKFYLAYMIHNGKVEKVSKLD